MKKFTLSIIVSILAFFPVWSVAPAGYYSSCEGKSGKALLQQLNTVIGNHTDVGYDGLWTLYKTSDVKPNGKIWDMYSTKEWTPGNEQCGNYTYVGSCYNREHSFPKSWFGKAAPMVSDAFHIYPTDGKVNGQRSNYPYGECANGKTLSGNGNVKALGKLGSSTFPGYSGTVFEPVDEYKGDFARSYFYMAACYNDRIAGWSSDMLAKNNYPAFTNWAINLLLKWHRQDPVSEKETKRNDVVYGRQKNRNPFIDHPELVEHIWGNKTSEGWSPNGSDPEPELVLPADGSSIDLGLAGLGVSRSVNIRIQGSGLKQALSVSVSGQGFSCATKSLPAQAVNEGTSINISFTSATAGTSTGRLVLTSGNATSTVQLTAKAVSGIPALPAFDVTETSFRAAWVNIDSRDAVYNLNVYLNGEMLDGYPTQVMADSEWEDVDCLEPGTTYTYTLSYGSQTSNVVEVTTATPEPYIQFLYDGELEFVTRAGEPSEPVAELLLDIENVTGDILVTVTAPFEVSTDKVTWSHSVTIAEGEDRMYLRLYGDIAGSYTTDICATAGNYMNDDAVATGIITRAGGFFEDFETTELATYATSVFQGTASKWQMQKAGVWDKTSGQDTPYEGDKVCRLSKDQNSGLYTSEPKAGGAGIVSFYAKRWGNDAEAKIKVQYSHDAYTWTDAGVFTISSTGYTEHKATVNVTGNVYIKLVKTSGQRVNIDNISITDYSGVGAVDELYYHSWDAYCRDHRLVIENKTPGDIFQVYGINGAEYLDRALPQGETSLTLSPGLYIVVQGDFSRRVLIK